MIIMEELSSQMDNKENEFLCLICGSSVNQPVSSEPTGDCGISKQLNVIFILKNLLQVPNHQLHKLLKKCGNPENWVTLCDDQCSQLIQEAWDLHLQILQITRKLKGYQKLIVEKVKSSRNTSPDGIDCDDNGNGRSSEANKLFIWKETRKFVRNYNYDDLCEEEDHILKVNQLPSLTLQNNQENSEISPKIKTEPEVAEPINNFEDLFPGTPLSPNQDYQEDDWVPPSSPSSSGEDPKVTPDNLGVTISKPKRIRNRHPPLSPSQFTIECLHCPLKFRFYSQVFAHMHATHAISDYPCLHPNCSSVLATIKQYSKHHVKHHLQPPKPPKPPKLKKKKAKAPPPEEPQPRVVCEICGGDFASKSNLQQHIKFVHEKSKIFKRFDVSCHLCGVVVKNVNMRLHLLRKHKDEAVVPQRKVKGQKGPVELASLFKCPVIGCKIEYLRKEGLDKHMISAHGVGGGDGGDGGEDVKVYRYSCMYCGKGFSIKRKLTHHEMVHRNHQLNEKPFKCDLCEKGFSTKKYLSYHKYNTHKLAKKFRMQNS